MLEYLIVALIVAGAGWRFALPYLRRSRAGAAACGSGSGCGGCATQCEPAAPDARVIRIHRAG